MAFDLDDEENEATRKMNGASKERKEENMDIEVGEYVRTNKGNIGQVIGIFNGHCQAEYLIQFQGKVKVKRQYLSIHTIIKHSKQLIDLIEVGDIVNSCIVVGFGYECVNGNKEKSILVEGKYTKVNFALLNWDIKTIQTKESYMANCYDVGRKDE